MSDFLEMKELLCEQLKRKTAFSEVELVSSILIEVLCEAFGGEPIYIPNRKCSRIHAKLRAKFNGHNHRELAHEFDYSVRNVYQILKNEKSQQLNL